LRLVLMLRRKLRERGREMHSRSLIYNTHLTIPFTGHTLSLCGAARIADKKRPQGPGETRMTTYQVTSPALAERYFEQSFVGDVAAFVVLLARKLRRFAGVVSHYAGLAREAEARR
jgi:hypothetical protein